MRRTFLSLVLIVTVTMACSFAMPLNSETSTQENGGDSPKYQSVASRLRGSGNTEGNKVIGGAKPRPRPPPSNMGGFGGAASSRGSDGKNGGGDPKSGSRALHGTTNTKEKGSISPESQSVASRLRGSRIPKGSKVNGGGKPKPRPPPSNMGGFGSTAGSRAKNGGGNPKSKGNVGGNPKSQSVASRLGGLNSVKDSRAKENTTPKPRPPPSNMGGFGSTTGTGKNFVSRSFMS